MEPRQGTWIKSWDIKTRHFSSGRPSLFSPSSAPFRLTKIGHEESEGLSENPEWAVHFGLPRYPNIYFAFSALVSFLCRSRCVATTSKKVHEFSCTNRGGGKITGGNNAIDWAGELARALREMDDISPGRPLRGAIR